MSVICEYRETELTVELATPIAELACLCFSSSGPTLEDRVQEILDAQGSDDPQVTSSRRFVIWDGGNAVAHARTFVRVITVAGRQIPVLALASVCTHPKVRGQGLGAKVTARAFAQIGKSDWPAGEPVSNARAGILQKAEQSDCDQPICGRYQLSLSRCQSMARRYRHDLSRRIRLARWDRRFERTRLLSEHHVGRSVSDDDSDALALSGLRQSSRPDTSSDFLNPINVVWRRPIQGGKNQLLPTPCTLRQVSFRQSWKCSADRFWSC